MKQVGKYLKKAGVLAIGIPVLALGIILIPLPGPGLLVTLMGLLILSMEFELARKYRDKLKKKFKNIYHDSKNRSDSIKEKYHKDNKQK